MEVLLEENHACLSYAEIHIRTQTSKGLHETTSIMFVLRKGKIPEVLVGEVLFPEDWVATRSCNTFLITPVSMDSQKQLQSTQTPKTYRDIVHENKSQKLETSAFAARRSLHPKDILTCPTELSKISLDIMMDTQNTTLHTSID